MPIREIRDIIFGIFKTSPFKIIPRQKVLWGIILLLGLSILLYQSLLAQQLRRSKIMRFCLLAQKRLFTCQQKIIKDPPLLLSKIEKKWGELKNLEKRFLLKQEVGQIIDDLKNLINRTENHLVSLDIKPVVSLESYQKLPLVISVKGHYVDIILLLNKFEGYPHLIGIKDIKIQQSGAKSSEVMMNLEAELFVVKD